MRGDLQQRLDFLDLEADDFERLALLRPIIEEQADRLVDAFYQHLLAFRPTRKLLRDPEVVQRLLGKQREYLLTLAGPKIDEDYVNDRRRIGATHERIGLEPRWVLGAYALYLSLLTPLVIEARAGDPQEAARTLNSLQSLLFFDAQLAIESYIERSEVDLQRLNQELGKAGRRLQRDFSDQRRELGETTRRARAAEQLASIANLVAGLAHEIGTPMGVIQGHAKLLEYAVQGRESRSGGCKTIQEQIGRISGIIQTLLEHGATQEAQRVPRRSRAAARDARCSFLTEKLRARNRDRAAVRARSSVAGDPERLQQLFLNLFLNAADAMPDGGVLRVGLEATGDGELEIRVADTGIGDFAGGSRPDLQSLLHHQGRRAGQRARPDGVRGHRRRSRRVPSSVVSTPGKGTEFQIRLPGPRGTEKPRQSRGLERFFAALRLSNVA